MNEITAQDSIPATHRPPTTAIGGYFGLELPAAHAFPHDEGVLMSSGAAALRLLLRTLAPGGCRVWLPRYTCHTVGEAVRAEGCEPCPYNINERLEIDGELPAAGGDLIIANNYFGLKDDYIRRLARRYGSRLIADNAQALFADVPYGISAIYSPRKWVGVPDGGIAVVRDIARERIAIAQERIPAPHRRSVSWDLCQALLMRHDLGAEAGYEAFQQAEARIAARGPERMSRLTERLLRTIDYDGISRRRLANFRFLHSRLAATNGLDLTLTGRGACPMVYPYLTGDESLRERLIYNKVFVARYWPDVLASCPATSLEHKLASRLIALPIDQRYGEAQMHRVAEIINGK